MQFAINPPAMTSLMSRAARLNRRTYIAVLSVQHETTGAPIAAPPEPHDPTGAAMAALCVPHDPTGAAMAALLVISRIIIKAA